MTGGLAFVVRILAMKHTRFYFPRCCPFCLSLGVRRSHCGGSLEVIVLPFLLLWLSLRGLPQAAPQFVLYPGTSRAETTFAMMLEERIIPLI